LTGLEPALWQDFAMLRWLTAGESHGPALMAVLEGLPAGVEVTTSDVAAALARRRLGFGRGARMKFEQDAVELLGGVRHGLTIGSPLAIRIGNSEWAKWETVMSPDPVSADALEAAGDIGAPQEIARNKPLTRPRPGHADPVRTLDPADSAAMVAEVEAAKRDGDTLGGVVEVLAYGLPPGLGSHVHWDRRLDSQLAAALMGIQAIKGVEVGDGFLTAARRGSAAHDEIDRDEGGVIRRRTGRAGGTEGGMSTGDVLRVRAAMKPISTVPKALATVDLATGESATAIHQRSDVCAVPAAGVVAEAMVALVLAQACVEKFGGDSVAETSRNHRGYLDAIPENLRSW